LAPDRDKVSFGDLNGRPSSCFLADQLISFSRQFLDFPPRPAISRSEASIADLC